MLVRDYIASIIDESLGADQADQGDYSRVESLLGSAINEIHSCVGAFGRGKEIVLLLDRLDDERRIFFSEDELSESSIVSIMSAIGLVGGFGTDLSIVSPFTIGDYAKDQVGLSSEGDYVKFSGFSSAFTSVHLTVFMDSIFFDEGDQLSKIYPSYVFSIIKRAILSYMNAFDKGRPDFFYDKRIISDNDMWSIRRFFESTYGSKFNKAKRYIGR